MTDETLPRRDLLRTGVGAVAATFAGCVGSGDEGTPTPRSSGSDGAGPAAGARRVTMAPVGTVSLDKPPERVAHYFPGYADMAVALGRGDTVTSIGVPDRYYTSMYDELDGVGVDKRSLTPLVGDNGIDKEVFYELDSDLHLIDPRWLTNNGFFGLDGSDVAELKSTVAPFLGNCIFRRTDAWHDYRYYTMYEAFEKVARVHGERAKFESFREFHDGVVDDVKSKLPPEGERPNAILVYAAADAPEKFSPYRVGDKGTNKKQFHDLGIGDALAGTDIKGLSTNDRGEIDYEAMLEVDPDSILLRGHETKTAEEFRKTVLSFMRDHDTASRLTAVKEGRVFRGGPIYAGPIQNLFLTERFARVYFPDSFEGELFDRGELSDIIAG